MKLVVRVLFLRHLGSIVAKNAEWKGLLRTKQRRDNCVGTVKIQTRLCVVGSAKR